MKAGWQFSLVVIYVPHGQHLFLQKWFCADWPGGGGGEFFGSPQTLNRPHSHFAPHSCSSTTLLDILNMHTPHFNKNNTGSSFSFIESPSVRPLADPTIFTPI